MPMLGWFLHGGLRSRERQGWRVQHCRDSDRPRAIADTPGFDDPPAKRLSEDGNSFSAQHLGANGSDAKHASRSLLCVLRARNKQINSRRPYGTAPTFQLKIPAVGAHSPCAAPPNPGAPLRSLPPHIVERERVGWPQLAALAVETRTRIGQA